MRKRDGYTTDLAQFHDLINQMDNHVKMLRQKKTDKAIELEESNNTLSATSTKIAELKNSIRSQDLSLQAARNLQSAIKGISEAVHRLKSLNQNRRNLATQKGVEEVDVWTSVEDFVASYNRNLKEIVPLLPPNEIDLAKFAIAERKVISNGFLLGDDLEIVMEKRILELKGKLVSWMTSAKLQFQETLDKLGDCEGRLEAELETLKVFERKKFLQEETLYNELQMNEAKCSVRLREVESLEARIAALRDPGIFEGKTALFESQCTKLEALRLQNRVSSIALISKILKEIDDASSAIDKFEFFFSVKAKENQRCKSDFQSSCEQLGLDSTLL